MKKKLFYLNFTFIFLFLNLYSEAKVNTDSLLRQLKNRNLTDSVRYYISETLINQNVYSEPQLALKYALIFEEIAKEDGNKVWIADVYWKKGIIYRELNDTKKAIAAFFDALELAKKRKDDALISKVYNSLGSLYINQKNHKKARGYFEMSLELSKKSKDKLDLADAFINMGGIEKIMENYTEAINFTRRALPIYQELKDRDGEAYVYSNLASIFENTNTFADSAIYYHTKSLEIFLSFRNHRSVSTTYNNMGINYLKKKDFHNSEKYCLLAYQLAKEHQLINNKRVACQCLYMTYEEKKDKLKGYTYLKEYYQLKDSLFDEEAISEDGRREAQLKYRETQIEDSLSQAKLDAENKLKHDQEVEKQKLYTYVGIGISILALAFLLVVYRGLRQKKRANSILEEKNGVIQKQKRDVEEQKMIIEEKQKEIIDSINYAKRLQQAILAPKEEIDKYIPNNFLFYKPKDIVAGDFYFFETTDDFIFYAAADCTGHGVPGAMVSIVCSNALHRSVIEFSINDPGKILDKTRELIVETFKKSGQDVKDGMDISFISINRHTKEIKWAGANNPLWYFENGKLHELKADKQPIGKTDRLQYFTTHTLPHSISTLFLFTDGFADQFGGEKGKKFKYSNLEKILMENQKIELSELLQILTVSFDNWKGELEQVDDVCIIGVKI